MSRDIARLPLRRVNDEPAETVLRGTVGLLAGLLRWVTDQDWHGRDNIPTSGGVLFVVNHISYFDPLAYGHYLTWAGRWPRFLAKDAIFRAPVVGWIARHSGQIEVHRGTADAGAAVTAAVQAIRAGRGVTIYPEGTITADPLGWPMAGHTGAARIALTAQCPVVPVGQWGAHEVMPGKRPTWPRLWPRKTMRVMAGEPVALADLWERPVDGAVLQEATERIMTTITDLVAQLRQETPPPGRWDLAAGQRREMGQQ